jgi:hypothetical protein
MDTVAQASLPAHFLAMKIVIARSAGVPSVILSRRSGSDGVSKDLTPRIFSRCDLSESLIFVEKSRIQRIRGHAELAAVTEWPSCWKISGEKEEWT